MDSFLIVLVIALALIVVFGFFFINAPLPGAKENLTLVDFDVGWVGFSSSIPSKGILIGDFIAGLQQEETIRHIPQLKVSSNYLGSEKIEEPVLVTQDVLGNLEKMSIDFNVLESSDYSNLVVEWNGGKVFDDKAKGIQNIQIPKENITSQNIIKMHTDPPGPYFWATSLYQIEDLKVKQQFADSGRPFPFTLNLSEYENLERGELRFFVPTQSSPGNLIVKLNGEEIYNRYPDFVVTVPLDSNKFLIGNNVLTFSARSSVFSLYQTNLSLFSSTKTVTKQKNFNIDQTRFDKLKNDTVTLIVDVKYVDKPGSLVVELNGNRIQLDLKEYGLKTVIFDKSYLKKGENTILFKTAGNFEINRIKIVQ